MNVNSPPFFSPFSSSLNSLQLPSEKQYLLPTSFGKTRTKKKESVFLDQNETKSTPILTTAVTIIAINNDDRQSL